MYYQALRTQMGMGMCHNKIQTMSFQCCTHIWVNLRTKCSFVLLTVEY